MNITLQILSAICLSQAAPSPTVKAPGQQAATTSKPLAQVRRSAPVTPKATGSKAPDKAAKPSARKATARRTKPQPQAKKTTARMAPQACRNIVDQLIEHTDAVLRPLLDEIRLGEKKNLPRGHQAALDALERHTPKILSLRREAATLQHTLAAEEKTRCDGYAFTAFHRLLTRYAAAIAPYRAYPDVLKRLGSLYRESSEESASGETHHEESQPMSGTAHIKTIENSEQP